MNLLSLDEYTQMAIRLISSDKLNLWMLQDEYIGTVINYLVKADMTYDSDKGASLKTFRFNAWKQAKFCILLDRKRMSKYIDLDSIGDIPKSIDKISSENDKTQKIFNEVLGCPELTATERKYLTRLYSDGEIPKKLCKKLKISKQAISYTKQRALNKLRDIYKCSGTQNQKTNQKTKK